MSDVSVPDAAQALLDALTRHEEQGHEPCFGCGRFTDGPEPKHMASCPVPALRAALAAAPPTPEPIDWTCPACRRGDHADCLDAGPGVCVCAATDHGAAAPPTLFVPGEFVAHSGQTLRWKIECDALTPDDWEGLALAAVDVLPPFGAVVGVPRGGVAFAQALSAHSTPGGPLLIADDVCTTGASLEEHRAGRDAIGVVAFARGPVPGWVTPLFRLAAAPPTPTDEAWHQDRIAEVLNDYLPDAIAYQWAQPVARELVHRLPHVFAGQLTASATKDALDEAKRIAGVAVDSARLQALADELATLLAAAPPDDEPADLREENERLRSHMAVLTDGLNEAQRRLVYLDDLASLAKQAPEGTQITITVPDHLAAERLDRLEHDLRQAGVQRETHRQVAADLKRENAELRAAAGSPPPTPDDPRPEMTRGLTEMQRQQTYHEGWCAGYADGHFGGPPPTNGPTRQQIADVLDELVAETLRRAASSSTDWVEAEVDRATDAVLSLWTSHRPDNDPEADDGE